LRYRSLTNTDPAEAERLHGLAEQAVDQRWDVYEEMATRGAQQFAADGAEGSLMDLSTGYMGLTLRNPLVASASPLSQTVDDVRRLADALGKTDDAERYMLRSRDWRSLIDPATKFPRSRNTDGVFAGNPDPALSEGFHEGTAWQYQWLVPQDLPGLIKAVGGKEEAIARLDHFFDYDELLTDPAAGDPEGLGQQRLRLLRAEPLQPAERARPSRALRLLVDRPAVEDGRCRPGRDDALHRRPDRPDRQRRLGHDVGVARPVVDRDLPCPGRDRANSSSDPRSSPR